MYSGQIVADVLVKPDGKVGVVDLQPRRQRYGRKPWINNGADEISMRRKWPRERAQGQPCATWQ